MSEVDRPCLFFIDSNILGVYATILLTITLTDEPFEICKKP
jgi:hypothetical protein